MAKKRKEVKRKMVGKFLSKRVGTSSTFAIMEVKGTSNCHMFFVHLFCLWYDLFNSFNLTQYDLFDTFNPFQHVFVI